MTVYIVTFFRYRYWEDEIISVYDSREKAVQSLGQMEKVEDTSLEAGYFSIIEKELE